MPKFVSKEDAVAALEEHDRIKTDVADMLSDSLPTEEEVKEDAEELEGGEVRSEEQAETGEDVSDQSVPEGDEAELPDGKEEQEPEQEEEVVAEKEESELSRLTALVERQAQMIENLTGKQQEEIDIPDAAESEIPMLISEEEFEQAMSSRESLNNLLVKVVAHTSEKLTRDIPQLTLKTLQRQQEISSAVNNFYRQNPELVEHKEYVGYLLEQVRQELPKANIGEVFSETAKRAYKNLNISKQAVERENQRRSSNGAATEELEGPAFASKPKGGGKRSAPADTRSEQQKQIDELIQ